MTEQARNRQQSATIYAVADLAQVSIATVSRVLQGSPVVTEKTRQKVLAAVDQLDYLPSGAARSLAVRHHDTYGLVLPELSGPYYAELLVGFETRAAQLDQSVMLVLAGTKKDRGQAVRTLATRVDGIAVLGSDVAHVGGSTKPLVVIAGHASSGIETVTAENIEGARRITEHLLDHGRTRLRFVGDPSAAHDVGERHQGFLAAHHDRGLEPAAPVLASFREEEGTAVAERIVAGDIDTDALVCGNDELALAIMARLTDRGVSVPGDIAVVGWDDVMTSRYVRPGLTTVRQPVQAVGALAADRLHHLVSGAAPSAVRHVLPTEVVIRSSCGCPGEVGPPPSRP
ncbi:LacI family DNA-binding transcriptional regulator [Oryzobacter telluris]|uniref:LacI family DNA-binding transcriptional regulator n=1 Tax=Oryzobacter telluris TaxID=3149179 RepID=UPI00370D5283